MAVYGAGLYGAGIYGIGVLEEEEVEVPVSAPGGGLRRYGAFPELLKVVFSDIEREDEELVLILAALDS